jgi:hypothetical protein
VWTKLGGKTIGQNGAAKLSFVTNKKATGNVTIQPQN